MTTWKWNRYQLTTFATASACDVLVQAGGRGSSKSTASFGLLLRTAQECPGSRSLLARTTEQALRAPWLGFREFLDKLGVAHTANESDGEIRIGTSTVVFGVCETQAYWERTWRGSEFVTIVVQEAASFVIPDTWLLLLSNCRSTRYKTLFVIESNPGPSGWWLERVFLEPARKLSKGTPFPCPELGGLRTIALLSSLDDNPAIDARQYDAALRAAAAGSDAVYERERRGAFGLISGALFPLRSCHHVSWPVPSDWREFTNLKIIAGADHGSRSPFAVLLAAQHIADGICPDGTWYPRGSFTFIGEATSADPGANYMRAAYEASIQDVARAYHDECERLNLREAPVAWIDSQVSQNHGGADPLINEYRRYMRVQPVVKGRVIDGIRRIRELMVASQPPHAIGERRSLLSGLGASGQYYDAASARVLPGLYLDPRKTPYFAYAIANCTANPKDPETIDPNSRLDHCIDACRYLLESTGARITAPDARRTGGPHTVPSELNPLSASFIPPWLRPGPKGVAAAKAEADNARRKRAYIGKGHGLTSSKYTR